MKKTQIILGLIAGLMVLFSCVPPDPAAVYGPNWNNNGNSGNGITGPRILHKVMLNNQLVAEYTSTNTGVLNKVDLYTYDGTALYSHSIININYNSSNKISYFEIKTDVTGNPMSVTYKVYPTYDASGKIVSYLNDQYSNNGLVFNLKGIITYNSNSQPVTIIEKQFVKDDPFDPNSTYVWSGFQKEISMQYVGANVVKVITNNKQFDADINVLLNNSLLSTLEYSQYEDKNSPYSTLSKDFLQLHGIFASELLSRISLNNYLKMKLTYPGIQTIDLNYTYQYDAQNYMTSGDGFVYIYKPIQ